MANPFVKDLYGNQIEVTNLPAAISQAFGGIGIDNVNFSPFRITKDGLSEDIKGRENELISASKYWEHLHFHLLLLKAILARKEKISSKDTFKEVAEKYLYGLVFTEITCEIITEIEESLSSLIIVSHYDIDMEESKLITFANGKRVSDLITVSYTHLTLPTKRIV